MERGLTVIMFTAESPRFTPGFGKPETKEHPMLSIASYTQFLGGFVRAVFMAGVGGTNGISPSASLQTRPHNFTLAACQRPKKKARFVSARPRRRGEHGRPVTHQYCTTFNAASAFTTSGGVRLFTGQWHRRQPHATVRT